MSIPKLEFSAPLPIQELKADAGDEWLVDGYVSTFGNVDLGSDQVMPGAFKETLKSGPKVRFLHSHDPRLVLGVPKKLKEDSKGLFGSFKISKTQLGEETRQLLLDGAIESFSIGYRTVDYKIVDQDANNMGVRQLLKIDLYEASLVAMPMNPDAAVTRVKDAMTLAEKAGLLNDELAQLLNDVRELVKGIDRPLSETKRQELTELLELCSGLDAVRSDLTSVLAAAPVPLVDARLTSYNLASARKRLAHILKE